MIWKRDIWSFYFVPLKQDYMGVICLKFMSNIRKLNIGGAKYNKCHSLGCKICVRKVEFAKCKI